MNDSLAIHGVCVNHHFGGGTYAKETLIPEGVTLVQHSHPYAHLSILASGVAVVEVDGERLEAVGPACLTIRAHAVHSVKAITPVTWYCVHATDDDNPETVDRTILHG